MPWAPTIALSWLSGLGFFYAFHVTLADGLSGLLAFAVPNACGLFAFGWILGDPKRNPAEIFRNVQGRFTGLFLACQVVAVAVTLFAGVRYLFIPLFGVSSSLLVVVLALLALAVGHATTIRGLKSLHTIYLVAGLFAALALLAGLSLGEPAHRVVPGSFDGHSFGLLIPSLVGFALGPWANVQQWQRVIAIRQDGSSVRAAYGWGTALLLVLIGVNAAIAVAAGPVFAVVSIDGLTEWQASVAVAVLHSGRTGLEVALVVWAGVVIASTLDSFYAATSWLLTSTASTSTSPLLAFIPAGLVTSPMWFLLTAALIADLMITTNASMIDLMISFATVLAGPAACLLCETISRQRRYDGALSLMIGTAAFLIFVIGSVGNVPAFIAIAPLIALIGSFPAMKACFETTVAPSSSQPAPASLAPFVPMLTINVAVQETVLGHGFDGQWFVMNITPTYDDTNSVGNVYFANYFRWVGKTRELFFNACMPDFNLHTSDFYVLTKSFAHEFRREIREFQPVSVRVRIGSYNRKFVTIVHEIHSRTDGLIGRGEQTIMFVDKTHYRPLDIPAIILQRFLPYYTPNAPARAPSPPAVVPHSA